LLRCLRFKSCGLDLIVNLMIEQRTFFNLTVDLARHSTYIPPQTNPSFCVDDEEMTNIDTGQTIVDFSQ